MLRLITILAFLITFVSFSQRSFVPTVHLNPGDELEEATITTLAEDVYGRVWFGTKNGIRIWDGFEVSKPFGNGKVINNLYARDSLIYYVDLEAIVQVNVSTLKKKTFRFKTSDYRTGYFGDHIELVSADKKESISLDYDLNLVDQASVNQIPKVEKLENTKFFIDDNFVGYKVVNGDTMNLTNTFVNSMLRFDKKTIFIATQSGLIEYRNEDSIEQYRHLQNQRVEAILKSSSGNLWVGTADNGLLMFHRNQILNEYYSMKSNANEPISGWRFFTYQDEVFVCSSKGVLKIPTSEDKELIEKKTENMFCLSAIANENFVLIGTAHNGLYKFQNGELSQILYNKDNVLDNTIIQIIDDGDSYVVTTKCKMYRFSADGVLLYSMPFTSYSSNSYSMNMIKGDSSYIVAGTDGYRTYSKDLILSKHIQPKNLRVISDVASYQNDIWVISYDDGIYKLKDDSLYQVFPSKTKLVGAVPFKDEMWGTSLNGVFKVEKNKFFEYNQLNGFPIVEHSQGGIYRKDSIVYFSGLGGVFKYNTKTPTKLKLPSLIMKYRNEFLPNKSEITINQDESIVLLNPKVIMLSDKNKFLLTYKSNNEWKTFENGEDLLVRLDYGQSEIQFKIKNIENNQERIIPFTFFRPKPIWLTLWFKLLMVFVGILLLFGIYIFIRFIKTKKQLKIEENERKIGQERLRISRELHDNIGARLSHIISSLDIEMFKNKTSDEIGTITAFAKETMTQLRETIWAINDKTIYFSELKSRIEHYISQTNNISVMSIVFSDKSEDDFELNAMQTINLFRMVQEGINNAIKYSQGSKIEVIIDKQMNRYRIQVIDDGIGFDTDNALKLGSGLQGLKHRAEEMAATLQIISNTNKGTQLMIAWD